MKVGIDTIDHQWKRIPQRYGSPIEALYCGEIRVGDVFWHKVSKSDPESYRYVCKLPGLKEEFSSGQLPTQDESKKHLEYIVRRWFSLVNKN